MGTAVLPLSELERRGATESYYDVEKLIYKICHDFQNRFGGDFDELVADANSYYMKAFCAKTFDSNKSRFSTWVRNAVWRGLLDSHTRARRRRVQVLANGEDLNLRTGKPDRMFGDFLAELSGDAAAVAQMVVEMPEDFYALTAGSEKPRHIRSALQSYLSGLGWAAERVANAFTEIGEALQ